MRQCHVRMTPRSAAQAATARPKDRRAVSLTRWLTGLRKALVRAG
jgi:hypothetical protein